jgi:hypothetical protein
MTKPVLEFLKDLKNKNLTDNETQIMLQSKGIKSIEIITETFQDKKSISCLMIETLDNKRDAFRTEEDILNKLKEIYN